MLHAEKEVSSTQEFEITVNINQADSEELDKLLLGIGPSKADAIIDWREKNGEFISIDQLAEVSGIGKATIEKNRERIKLN
ncbi:ComEA family DNA-binding protein [Vibrio sp. SS-MA-C1-2]|nr:ComEA family DNA-binding protein [Vibrio sp. SS-MA-C1-2]UJF20111.1 ComEA family DNA-binding protein [Vibrio sp. SS-MA-C1-2]